MMPAAGIAAAAPRARPLLAERIAAWLPALVLVYPLLIWPLMSAPPAGTHELAAASPEPDSNLANRLYFPLAFLCAMAACLTVPLSRFRPLRGGALFLICAFMAWAAASVLWAVDPGISARRLVQQLCVLAAVIPAVLVARDINAVISRLFLVIALAALVNMAYVAVLPPGPIGHEGIYSQKNMLGAATAVFLIAALHQLFAGPPLMRLLAPVIILGSAYMLIASQSKTSLGIMVLAPFAALVLLVAGRAFRLSPAVVVACVLTVIAIGYQIGVSAGLFDFPLIAQTLFGDPTLTSRTDIWAFAADMIDRRPMLGYGYQSFWGIGYEGPSYREARGFIAAMPHAHNGYLDSMLQTGLPGLAILVAMIAAALHTAVAPRTPPALSWLALTTIIFTIGHNFLETTWFQGYSFIWIMFVIMVAIAARNRYRDA